MKKILENLLRRNNDLHGDLRPEESEAITALVAFLTTAKAEVSVALGVPAWENHCGDDGVPHNLGTVCATYGSWIQDESGDLVGDHDGAQQLAEVALALPKTLDLLEDLIN